MTSRPSPDDTGNITLTTLALAIPLALLAVLAISCAMVFARWTTLSSGLSVARETTLTAGFQMMLKSSVEPGKLVAEKLADEVRRAGIDDELTVWFVESRDPTLGDNARALAYHAVITTTYGASTLLGPIDIPASVSASIVPYSAEHVFKPPTTGAIEVYRFAQGSRTSDVTVLPPSEAAPPALANALTEAERKARTYEP